MLNWSAVLIILVKYSISITSTVQSVDATVTTTAPPTIQVELLEDNFISCYKGSPRGPVHFLTSKKLGNFSIHNGSIQAHHLDYYRLSCTSPYLSKWISTIGFFPNPSSRIPTDSSKVNPAEYQDLKTLEYLQSPRQLPFFPSPHAHISQSDVHNTSTSKIQLLFQIRGGFSGSITCQHIHNPSIYSRLYFYVIGVRGGGSTTNINKFASQTIQPHSHSHSTPTKEDAGYLTPNFQYYEKSERLIVVIPCRSNFKSFHPQSLQWSTISDNTAHNTLFLDNSTYDPTTGFHVDITDFNETHLSSRTSVECTFDTRNATYTQAFRFAFREVGAVKTDFENWLNQSKFENGVFGFKGPSPFVSLDLQSQKSIFKPTVSIIQSTMVLPPSSIDDERRKYEICYLAEGSVPPDGSLKRNSTLTTIVCSSSSPSANSDSNPSDRIYGLTRVIIKCDFPYACQFYLPYMENPDDLPTSSVSDWSRLVENGAVTAQSSNIYSRGLVGCFWATDSNRERTFDYFFTGLDKHIYILSDPDIPRAVILNIREIAKVLYSNDSVAVVCESNNFLLVPNSIVLAVGFGNGSIEYLNSTASSIVEDKQFGFSFLNFILHPTMGMTSLICLSPWSNSTDWFRTERKFEVRARSPPKIQNNFDNQRKRVFRFRKNADNHLECIAMGEPTPKIEWRGPNSTDVIDIRHYFVSSDGESSSLKFSAQSPFVPGVYTCVARNEHGVAEQEYNVGELDENELTIPISTGGIIGIVSAILIFLLLAVLLIVIGLKYLRARRELRCLTEEEVHEFLNGDDTACEEDVMGLPFQKFVIPESDLVIAKDVVLGEGQFGRVYRGFLLGDAVAVKTTKSGSVDVHLFKDFLKEVKTMAYVGSHEHIVGFCGAVITKVRERILLVVVELSPFGSLLSYLTTECRQKMQESKGGKFESKSGEMRKALISQCMNWSWQIADGMEFLYSKKLVHGDLAARNVLLFKKGQVKISDFGLSSRLYGYAEYVKKQTGPLPWAWMAVEALRYLKFSTASDVWSYGVTVYEIFSLGQVPYPGLRWTVDFVDKLNSGLRVEKPEFGSSDVHQLILKCCEGVPENRPSFSQLKGEWKRLMGAGVEGEETLSGNLYENESEMTHAGSEPRYNNLV